MAEPLLELRNVRKYYPAKVSFFGPRDQWIKAVDGISFTVNRGETLGIVGESGCGKTTTARIILASEPPSDGQILFEGRDVASLPPRELKSYRRDVQVVFQDPYSSLSPRMRVSEIVSEPLRVHRRVTRRQAMDRAVELLELVGLSADMVRRFPHEFSGGQRQRVAIARSLSTDSKLIVLDEPVSALDVSVRAHIITLLEDLQKKLGVSYVFIGHDLATVAHISDRIAVMYLGNVVEEGESVQICTDPRHPYTKALFSAALPAHPDTATPDMPLMGEIPSALAKPSGCAFHPRCPLATDRCRAEVPRLRTIAPGRTVACHHA